jgi:hypothetical protein
LYGRGYARPHEVDRGGHDDRQARRGAQGGARQRGWCPCLLKTRPGGAVLHAMAKACITMNYDRIHEVLGEGNFVLVVSEGQFAGKPTSFYDLFRVENGKIVEHWDVLQVVPTDSRNGNTMFWREESQRARRLPCGLQCHSR